MDKETMREAIGRVKKAKLDLDLIDNHIVRLHNVVSRAPCLYDEGEKMMYRDKPIDKPKFTYIAKSFIYDGVYKVGHSFNLSRRKIELANDLGLYREFGLHIVAFYEVDIEPYLISSLCGFHKFRPEPFNHVKELFFADEKTVNHLIKRIGFTRCDDNYLPSDLSLTYRYFYDNNGRPKKRKDLISYKDGNGVIIEKVISHIIA